MHVRATKKGFTLVELLVVISIIGVLSTLAIVAFTRARAAAREAKAKGDIKQMALAVGLLFADTGKWPNGCPVESVANPETYLDTQQAGIRQAPAVGDQGGGCTWTASDISGWAGPYAKTFVDPWGSKYYFDPDYVPLQNCSGQTAGDQAPAIVSFGPNKAGPNVYDCDDLWYVMR
ncbi:prepilin-type N-terminal cleavage/methylation domain-containing protein [Candidatus Uhrbacteria bacterium]|nr:prepilin-type N-terminal cleavage/methylation domain-containing protein [Candidatus Uhrbacteria bacterium]